MPSLYAHFEDIFRILTTAAVDSVDVAEDYEIAQAEDAGIGQLTFALRFTDGSTLHVDVTADCSDDSRGPLWKLYSFHYQDADHNVRFRYDNAPHHPELANFPHHLHIAGIRGVELSEEGPPSVREVARRVRQYFEPEETG